MSSLDTVIVGAGLSGLSAAYALYQNGKSVRIVDASSQAGGLIQTQAEAGFTFECGPHTFPSTAVELNQLCQQLGLKPQPVRSAHQRYLYLKGQLVCLPTKPWQVLTTPVLSFGAKCRALLEPFQPKTKTDDISIAEFFNHRLGNEITNHLVDPFVSGIYAGDIQKLSLPAVFPVLWQWEQSTGSLKGVLQAKKAKKKSDVQSQKMQLYGFQNGLKTLIDSLCKALPPDTIQLNQTVVRLEKNAGGYAVFLNSGKILQAKHVILATPAYVSAQLLQGLAPVASQALREIPYNALAVVHTGFKKEDIPHSLGGFGFLIPRQEKLPLLGTIWASSLFPERAPIGQVLLSSFIGGAHYPEIMNQSPETIESLVLQDLSMVFKTSKTLQPVFSKVLRYEKAIPQYTLGHQERITIIEQDLKPLKGLALCGNYIRGVALNQCAQSGLNAVKNISLR